MATGIVKWFDDAKGFGFITPDGDGEDLQASVYTSFQKTGTRALFSRTHDGRTETESPHAIATAMGRHPRPRGHLRAVDPAFRHVYTIVVVAQRP